MIPSVRVRAVSVRSFLKKTGGWLLALAISLVGIEILLHVAVTAGVADVDLPSYSLKQAEPFWQDVNPDFGTWHVSHGRFRHRRSCFDLVYTSNAFGMRHGPTALTSRSPRVVVLGDSFVEGWGVDAAARFTDRLAALTGFEHLNFGVAGDFGPTQALVLYRTLASRFAHDAVILTVLPENDFLDDLPSPQRLRRGARHRPFLVGTYPDYRLAYPEGAWSPEKHEGWHVKNVLREFWLTFRVGDHAIAVMQQVLAFWRKRGKFDLTHSFYFDYTPEDFGRLRYAIEQIKAAAGERPVLVVTIPVEMDYQRAKAAGTPPPLARELDAVASDLGITYVDLLAGMNDPPRARYFLQCDPHWSAFGHEQAARIISAWSYYRRLTARQPQ
jgi:hypothetical protein